MRCLATLAVVLSGLVLTPQRPQSLAKAARRLASPSPIEATEAASRLFRAGEVAQPHLIGRFSERSLFTGFCGHRMRASNFAIDGTSSREARSIVAPERAYPEVREVSAYLFLAILKGSLYFADGCRATVEGDRFTQLSLALGEVAILYESSRSTGRKLSSEDVERILAHHRISFPAVGTSK